MQDKELEQRLKKQDIQLLVTQLMRNEETVIKLIIDRLYDTGSDNWIDQKVRFRLANRSLKAVAKVGKPAGRYFGYRWLVKKTPRMISGWLMRQVSFKPKKKKPKAVKVEAVPQSILLNQQKQINQLQTRLRLTSGLAVVSIISAGGLFFANSHLLIQGQTQPATPVSQSSTLP